MDDLFNKIKEGAKKISLRREEKIYIAEKIKAHIQANPIREEIPVPSPYARGLKHRHLVYVVLSVLLVFGIGGSTSLLANYSLPGDALYPVKVNVNEKIESFLTTGVDADVKIESRLANERLEEVEALEKKGGVKEEVKNKLDKDLENHRDKLEKILEKEKDNEKKEKVKKIYENVKIHLDSREQEREKIREFRKTEEGEEDEGEEEDDAPVSAPAPSPTPVAGEYTMAQVATHNSKSDCWTAINGSVYNVTPWIDLHPGGSEKILSLCGKDGSAAFTTQHSGQSRPASELAAFKIGILKQQVDFPVII
ncbi:MAG TPA: cytochrome b5 domain-containing protein [Candidatus Paceibacterota bacterium]